MRYPVGIAIKPPVYLPSRIFEWRDYPSFIHAIPEHTEYEHFYISPSGERYPSVSKMLSKTTPDKDKGGIQRWRRQQGESVADYITNQARDNGTTTHSMMELYLNNKPIPHMSIPVRGHFYQLADLVQDVEYIHATEIEMYSGVMKLGGTCDGVGIINGKPTIFDYKTKRSVQKESYLNNYYLQLTCYGVMWEELTGQKIEQIVLFISTEPGFSQVFVKDPKDFTQELKERVEKFNTMV